MRRWWCPFLSIITKFSVALGKLAVNNEVVVIASGGGRSWRGRGAFSPSGTFCAVGLNSKIVSVSDTATAGYISSRSPWQFSSEYWQNLARITFAINLSPRCVKYFSLSDLGLKTQIYECIFSIALLHTENVPYISFNITSAKSSKFDWLYILYKFFERLKLFRI